MRVATGGSPSCWVVIQFAASSAALRMFFAAFTSAFSACPHLRHLNHDCERRLLRAVYPQHEHRCDVYAGSMYTIVIPYSPALYSSIICWRRNGHE